MTAALKKEIRLILEQVKIVSYNDFTIKGTHKKVENGKSSDLPRSNSLSPPEKLVDKLQGQLYNLCYTRSIQTSFEVSSTDFSDRGFMDALSKANAGPNKWDESWQVLSTDPSNGIKAQKGSWIKHFPHGHYQLNHAAPDQPVMASVFLSKESFDGQPGFYFAFGNARERIVFPEEYVRIYWHIIPEGAKELVRFITEKLNAYEVPFRFKCGSHAELYDRSDPAILYFKPSYSQIVVRLLTPVYKELLPYLKPEVPLFTKQIGKGVGLSEDPNTGESFGMHRCRLLAEAIVKGYEQGLVSETDKLAWVERYFGQQGFGLGTPYLNPGSVDVYPTNLDT